MNTTEILAAAVQTDLEFMDVPTDLLIQIHRNRHEVGTLSAIADALLPNCRDLEYGNTNHYLICAALGSVDWPTIYSLMDATEYEARLGSWESE